ncbi:MAG: transporter substrate-binding domain-containing protein [Pseudomonadota bacterium]
MTKSRLGLIAILATLLQWTGCAGAADKILRLATLEWPPYVGSHLLHEGVTTYIVKNTAAQIGYQVKNDYFPWSRAMQIGDNDPDFSGYFPTYFSTERNNQCYLSNSLGNSSIGFAYLKSTAFDWKEFPELVQQQVRIGIVHNYQNGEAFDALNRAKKLNTDVAPSDISNLRKLLAHRVQVAVIDKAVLRHLLATEPSLKPSQEQILFHDKELASLSLHICFHRNPEGRLMQAEFNAALSKLNLPRLENLYFSELEGK